MYTCETRERLHEAEASRSQLDFILLLLKSKLKDARLDATITALNFLGDADTIITVTNFTTQHARHAYQCTKLFMCKPIYAWELCHIKGVIFADEIKCSFLGGPPDYRLFNGSVSTLLFDRILRAVMVENRDILKKLFQIFDKSSQRGIVEV